MSRPAPRNHQGSRELPVAGRCAEAWRHSSMPEVSPGLARPVIIGGPMPWMPALLHGQVVYARANADGSFRVESGRVEVCYSLGASRLYLARASNLAKQEGAAIL